MIAYDILLALDRLILPTDLLACFDIVKIENGSETMTIYLDEQNLPPLSSSTLAHSLESKGFLPAIEIRDFPIRDNKVTLYVRHRK